MDSQGRVFQNGDLADDPKRLVSLEENDWANMEQVDSLKVVDFTRDRYLKKQGGSLWASNRESGQARPLDLGSSTKVIQGFLEGSNVNPVTEMVNMIEVNRAYEANQKMIQTQDNITGQLINKVLSV